MKSHFMSKLFPCLQETALHTSLTAKSAQLIAELAKTGKQSNYLYFSLSFMAHLAFSSF